MKRSDMKIMEDMMSEGKFLEEVLNFIDMSMEDFDIEVENKIRVRRLLKKCEQSCFSWWINFARTNIANKSFNSSLFMFVMKNKFGWIDSKRDLEKKISLENEQRKKQNLKKFKVVEAINGNS